VSVCLLRIGDGRDEYHERCWESAKDALPTFSRVITIDDREHKLGFSGAIAEGWRQVLQTGADYVFHLEMDFTFNAPVELAGMIELLEEKPHLAQVALKRQPVNAEERAAGGIVELHPDDFTQRVEGGIIWTENRRCFTTNPCVYSTNLCRHGWPQEPHSEGVFTHRLLADPDVAFAFWGGKFDAPLVEHIGESRAGGGY
jgi:hypothetical protein